MAWYTMECPDCTLIDEYQFDAKLSGKSAECHNCEKVLYTVENRIYRADIPRIEGETCSGSCSYSGYDEGLDEVITSKQHRSEVMKRKGFTEYNPDLSMKKHRDEARYIRERSLPNDSDAAAAIDKIYKAAGDKRRTRLVEESLDKSFKKLEVQ